MTHWTPQKNYFLMKNLKNPKHLMAKSINPIHAQGLICPYGKICSWTLIYQYQGLLSTFLFDWSLWSRYVVRGWSILMCYVVTSHTLFCSLAIAFNKTTLFPAHRDMCMWLTKTLLWPASSSSTCGCGSEIKIINITTYQMINYGMSTLFFGNNL